MPQQVKVGNDTLNFPDGMSDEDISKAIDAAYSPGVAHSAPPVAAAPAPDTAAVPEDTRPVSQGLGFAEGLIRPVSNLARWEHNADAAVGAGNFHSPVDVGGAAQGTLKDLQTQEATTKPGLVGSMAGSAISGLPLMAITRNPWLGGAMGGALQTNNPDDPKAVATDAALGGAMGGATDLGIRGAGSVIAPKINPMVRQLLDKGVELTPGQTLGGLPRRFEDASKSIFGVGDAIGGAQTRANESLNRVTLQTLALDPIGVKIPADIPAGHPQIDFAHKTLSAAYDNVLADIDKPRSVGVPGQNLTVPGAPGPTTSGVSLDRQFADGLQQVRKDAAGLGSDQQRTLKTIIDNQVKGVFDPQTGKASGRSLKDLDSFLGQKAKAFGASPNPYDRELSDAIQEVQAQTRDMLGRQYPQHAQLLDQLNQGWAGLVRVEAAAAPAKGGVATPSQLRMAMIAKAGGVKDRVASRNLALGQDFADAADRSMSPTLGESGTAPRALATGAAALALNGGALSHIAINPWGAAALGLAASPYLSRTTGGVARAAIAARPAGAAAVRQGLQAAAPAMAAGAGAVSPVLRRGQ